MNRSEYLIALYDALNDIPGHERTDIISEYQEYFKIEMEKGRTEEEICSSLGDPVTLAYAIKQRRGYGQFAKKHPQKQGPSGFPKPVRIFIGVAIAMSVFSILGFNVKRNIGLKNFNFGIGKKYDIDEEKEIDLGSAENIIIHVISSDTKVMVSDGNKVRASLKGTVRTTNENAVPKLEITRNGGSILIAERRDDIGLGSFSSNLKMDITIPREFNGKIDFEGTSGDFTSSNLDIESISMNLTSGDIKLEDVELDDMLRIVSTSGNIDIERLKAKESSIESISGDKKLHDFWIDGTVNIMSTSGNNRIKGMDCKNLVINSLSGNIEINGLEGGIQTESSSGNISISMTKVNNSIVINALSGDVKLKIPSDSGFALDCSAKSGIIGCDFVLENKRSDKRSLKGSYGSGIAPITISTSSGNISIKNE